MDKKIILSVLIVALIGIVAATYQINNGEDILNPLASVETEESPVTDVLTAPDTAEDTQAQADAQAQAEAQKQAQAQAEADAKAQAEAQAQADDQAQAVQAGQTSKRSSLVNADNGITVQSTPSGDSSGGSSSSDNANGNNPSAGGNDQSNPTTSTGDNSGSTGDTSGSPSDTPNDSNPVSGFTDDIRQKIEPVIQQYYDTNRLVLDWDDTEVQDDYYVIPAYYRDSNSYAGKFYVPKDNFSEWKFVASDLTVYTQETPIPGSPNLGEEDTGE